MTEASRIQHIHKALATHESSKEPERSPFPLSRGRTMLPVITVPVTVPVLNTKSFRIAPALRDHPMADLVKAQPDSPEAQKVVADLVRKRHRNADELKESLRDEGQTDPGVITRDGILINANTRCVLMNELLEEGQLRDNSMRVAVLPEDVDPAELYDLEAVLQKRTDHRDEYDLVSELMMLRTLHEEAGMGEAQIAKRQRTTPANIRLKFKMLALMERTCLLPDVPVKIGEFGGNQEQNWKELVTRVEKLDEEMGVEAGDNHLREFLHLHALDMGAVHLLRSAPPGWVDEHLMDALASQGGELGAKLAKLANEDTNGASAEPRDGAADGLDLLDFGIGNGDAGSKSVRSVLNVTMATRQAGSTGEVDLPDGSMVPAADVHEALTIATRTALRNSKREIAYGERLEKPHRMLEDARDALSGANRALADVLDEAEFVNSTTEIRALLDEVAAELAEARETLDGIETE